VIELLKLRSVLYWKTTVVKELFQLIVALRVYEDEDKLGAIAVAVGNVEVAKDIPGPYVVPMALVATTL
jgi:hypothetical protein